MTHQDTQPTGLLVSVRNLDEAKIASRAGASVVDVKEPKRGSLGAASIDVIRQITQQLAGQVPVSAACGELYDASPFPINELPPELTFAKIGLAGAASDANWKASYTAAWERLAPSIHKVAVAYADWEASDSPHPEEVAREGKSNGCKVFLIDTHYKTKCLFDLIPSAELDRWIKAAARDELKIVIAGSIRYDDISSVVNRWHPHLVAVRGAACHGGRESPISETKVKALRSQLDATQSARTKLLDFDF